MERDAIVPCLDGRVGVDKFKGTGSKPKLAEDDGMMSEKPKSCIGERDATVDVGVLSTDESDETVERRSPGVRGVMDRAEKWARTGRGWTNRKAQSESDLMTSNIIEENDNRLWRSHQESNEDQPHQKSHQVHMASELAHSRRKRLLLNREG